MNMTKHGPNTGAGGGNPQTIAVVSKGGVGKTTTSAALGERYASGGACTLIRDFDPMASLTIALGQMPSEQPLSDPPIHLSNLGSVWLARGGARMNEVSRSALDRALDEPTKFDVEIIDTPPHGVADLVIAPALRADLIIVPIGGSVMDLPALAEVMALAEHLPSKPSIRVLLTRVNSRRLITERVARHVEAEWPGALFETRIPDDARATEWPEEQLPVTMYAPSSRSAAAYRALVEEIVRTHHIGRVGDQGRP